MLSQNHEQEVAWAERRFNDLSYNLEMMKRAIERYQADSGSSARNRLLLLADVEYFSGNWDSALRHYNAVLAGAGDIDVYNKVSQIHQRKEDFGSALEAAEEALKLDEKNVSTLNNIATALLGLGRHQDSLPYLERALEGDATSKRALNLMTFALAHTHQVEEARRYAARSLELDRSQPYMSVLTEPKDVAFYALEMRKINSALGEILKAEPTPANLA